MISEKKPNGLINEKSPYLLQHAYNPVNWYPWGEEAFSKAAKENKPIFLSIGYSTCHWCHVMAHESFEDTEVAQILNENFIAIKVDKEERPDIDSVYMTVCQAFTQQGGWPLTIIMTADKNPFFAGTYFPKRSGYGVPGIIDILSQVIKQWQADPQKLISAGEDVTAILNRDKEDCPAEISKDLIFTTYRQLRSRFDPVNGGFSDKPKFPTPHNLLFLLRYAHFEQDKEALEMVEQTLRQMYRGGIYDHLGYGFSRYSTDEQWLVPHFEKMLYDNALLLMVYSEAYQITGISLYSNIAKQIIAYIAREMTGDEGGFYCAQDADSDGEEGKYYLLKPDEINKILGEKDAEYFNEYFDITHNGNFEGKNIPNLLKNIRFADKNDRIDQMKQKIFDYRLQRVSLHKDDKILTSWNALMIAALAKASRILGEKEYFSMAKRAWKFIEKNLMNEDYQLHVRYRDGEISGMGHADDYAFLIWALLEMYESDYDAGYLHTAIELNKVFAREFFDHAEGGFYLYGTGSEKLIIRPKELYDGAIPSANSVAAYNIHKLSQYTGKVEYQLTEEKQLRFIASNSAEYPSAYTFSMIALMSALYPSSELICVIKKEADINNFQQKIEKLFLPNTTTSLLNDKNIEVLNKIAPFTKDYETSSEKPVYYLCTNHSCYEPTQDMEVLLELLKQ